MEKQAFIEAGRITNTHGVAGEVKIEVWLDSPEFMKRFKRIYIDGRPCVLRSARVHKQFLLCSLEGVGDVIAAMALKGKTVFIAREDDEQEREIGILTEVMERPASNIYVVKGETEHLIPAVPEFIMSTDIEAGRITVRLIEGM